MNAPAQSDMLVIPDDSSIANRLICRVNSVAIKAAFPFIAEDDVRFYLCGVNIRPLDDGGVMIVATDGHRFVIVRDPNGYAETEVIAAVSKDAIKHADAKVTFDVMNNGSAVWNDIATQPVFVQPGKSVINGDFPRIESVIDCTGYLEGISGAVNMNFLADVLKIKMGTKAPAIRFFSRDEDSPLLFLLSGIGEVEVIGGIMKVRDALQWLPTWLPPRGEFKLQQESA
jgi:hypothetical protein